MARKASVYELKNNQLIALFDQLVAKRPDLLEEIWQWNFRSHNSNFQANKNFTSLKRAAYP